MLVISHNQCSNSSLNAVVHHKTDASFHRTSNVDSYGRTHDKNH